MVNSKDEKTSALLHKVGVKKSFKMLWKCFLLLQKMAKRRSNNCDCASKGAMIEQARVG